MSFETGEPLTTPQTIPAKSLGTFRWKSIRIADDKIVTLEYVTTDGTNSIRHIRILKNETDENGDPVAGQQRWDMLKTGFSVTEAGGATFSLALVDAAFRQILELLGDID